MFSLLLWRHLFWQKNSAVPCISCNLSLKFTAMHHWGSLKLIELNCFLYVFDVIFVFHINIDAVRPLCHCQFQDILFFHKAIFLLYSYMFQTKKKDKSYTNSCIHNLLCLLERSVILILWVEMVFMSAVLLIGLQIKRLIGKNSHYRNRKKKKWNLLMNRWKRWNNLSLTLTIRTSVKRCSW